MTEKRFNIIFKGEIVPGADEAAVKANVGKLFKANEKVLARLFSGEPIAIKKDVDKAGAMKYRALMKQAGALCYAQDPNEPLVASKPSSVKPSPEKPAPASKPVNPAHQEVASAKPAKGASTEEDWGIAPVGSDMGELPRAEAVEIPDISSISMAELGADVIENPVEKVYEPVPELDADIAPVGSDMGQETEEVEFELPDLGGLDLAPVGADVTDPVEKEFPEPPDVSNISVAPVGSDVADKKPEAPEPEVDISHIKLEH